MDTSIARKMHRTLEPYHAIVYFAAEPRQEYARIGLQGQRMGYFASRAAPMGAVPAEVVIATFMNFHPDVVRRAIPAAWSLASPPDILSARLTGTDRTLRRVLGDWATGAEVEEAADLARQASTACSLGGRPLYAAHASLPWPEEPHLVLWHALTLLREFRGDGHIAAVTCQGLSGAEVLVIHEATGALPVGVLQASRAWPDADWLAARAALHARGWLDEDGSLTDAGAEQRQWVEDITDELMMPCWTVLGDDRCQRLRELVRPASRQLAGEFSNGLDWDLD